VTPARATALARRLVDSATAKGLKVAAAESCTGGLVAAAITDIAGASAVFDRAFVTYSNAAKVELLGVRSETLASDGAVSEAAAREMAAGALARSQADVAVAITGIAGPSGGTADKPVGLVWFALARRGGALRAERRLFPAGGRALIRRRAAETALSLLLSAL
jgi:nicotinamide-nucleotide amidase